MKAVLLAIMVAVGGSAAPQETPFWLWWEAEEPTATNFPARHPFEPANAQEANSLSGGKWIGAEGEYAQKPLFLEYEVRVSRTGKYYFYARKFWKHGPFRWRFGEGEWRVCGREIALLDQVTLRQFVEANWVALGAIELQAGTHRLRIEMLEDRGAVAFDAFLLSDSYVVPRGKLKPNENYRLEMAGYFAFEPAPDPFRESPIDLRRLNEKYAGENGWIQVKDGQFVHGKTGQPIRFWAVNAGGDIVRMDNTSIDYLARWLAKRGVNMVRLHAPIHKQNDLGTVDEAFLERCFYFIHAMKQQGIYTTLSIFFPLWLNLKPEDGFGSYRHQHPFALLFFNERFQEIYKSWFRQLLTRRNPYSGLALRDDPAVAMVELVNEDSYFFWTFTPYENIPAEQMELLERAFGAWLARKYGSTEAALQQWGGERTRGDDPAQGRVGFVPLWQLANQPNRRTRDTIEFLARNQREFFERMQRYLKQTLGYKGLVQASNWITADTRVLGPVDKWTNTTCDYMDRHGYYNPKHEGERAAWALSVGDRYEDASALQRVESEALPLMDIIYNGLPAIISEVNWTLPNRYRAEFPVLAAAYGRLQGIDGIHFFALSGPSWAEMLGKFTIQTPAILGQFPATALIYRKGLVQEASSVATVNLVLEDLFQSKGAPVMQPVALDELRAKDIPAGQTASVDRLTALDPLTHLVGKVQMNFRENTSEPARIANLAPYIDRQAKVVRSVTDELRWDYGQGLVVLNAPKAQGATGFLKRAGEVQLGTFTLATDMEYGSVLLVALDEQPLTASKRMLLQVMSEETNYGWDAPLSGGLRQIKSLGAPPLNIKRFEGTLRFRRSDAAQLRITPLDANGYPSGQIVQGATLPLQPTVMYYLVESLTPTTQRQ